MMTTHVRIYSGADPVFDEGDVFRLTVPLDDDYSPEKGRLPKRKTTQQTTLQDELKARLGGVTLDVALLMAQQEGIKISEIAERVGLTRDGVNYHIRILKRRLDSPIRAQTSLGAGRLMSIDKGCVKDAKR